MRSDPGLFWAYEYGGFIGRPASEVLDLPTDEILGFLAHLKIKSEQRGV